MKNKIESGQKSKLPFLLIVLALVLILPITAFVLGTNGESEDEVSETVEVSATIPKETEETTETETEEITEPEIVALNFTQLYFDFFEPYEKSFDKLTLEEFQQTNNEKFSDYEVEIKNGNSENDLWSFKISDSNGDLIYMAFYPTNSTYENPIEDWKWTLTNLSYSSNGNEISISDRFHINAKPTYTIYDKNAETPSKEVTNIDELKEFMFK